MYISYMKLKPNKLLPFTNDNVLDRDLVIRMLQHEEIIATSDWGQNHYRDPFSRVSISLDNEYAFNRKTLSDYGFNTSNENVANYRTIFRTYFKDPDNYDKEVINASYYMRNNRCIFYRSIPLKGGDLLPNCRLYMLDGITKTDLHSAIRGKDKLHKFGLICAYSNS